MLTLDLIGFSKSEALLELVTRLCSENRVSNESSYVENYNRILNSMDRSMAENGYASGEMGKPPERLYVFSQCMGDVNVRDCLSCFFESREILSSCFPATGGRIFYNGCYIRAENYSFFDHTVEPDDFRVILILFFLLKKYYFLS